MFKKIILVLLFLFSILFLLFDLLIQTIIWIIKDNDPELIIDNTLLVRLVEGNIPQWLK